MTTVLEEQSTTTSATVNPARRFRIQTAAVRLSFTWMGIRKSLSADQKALAAETFGAEHDSLAATKRLINNKHPAFKAVTGVKSRIVSYFKGVSLPYPEPGIRLIRQDRVDAFNQQLQDFQEELSEAVWRLSEHYAELQNSARDRLGSLYDPADYPEDSFDNMKEVGARHGLTFPYAIDRTQEVGRAYNAVCTPDFFGFNKDLELQYRGRLDESKTTLVEGARRELHEAMAQIAETGQGPAEQIASMGCSIKWRAA